MIWFVGCVKFLERIVKITSSAALLVYGVTPQLVLITFFITSKIPTAAKITNATLLKNALSGCNMLLNALAITELSVKVVLILSNAFAFSFSC